jgi:hypothetical protein
MADEKKPKGEQQQKAAHKGGGDKPGKGDKGGGKKGRGEAPAATPSSRALVSNTPAVPPRLLDKYTADIIPALTKQFNYKNPNQVPRLRKIVVNMGLGAAVANPKIIDTAVEELRAAAGAEAHRDAREEGDRELQAPGRDPHRRHGHVASRTHV